MDTLSPLVPGPANVKKPASERTQPRGLEPESITESRTDKCMSACRDQTPPRTPFDCLAFFHVLYVSTVNERSRSPVCLWQTSDLALSCWGRALVRLDMSAGFLSSFLFSRPYLSVCYFSLLFGICGWAALLPS